ncbi:MAG: hypothetical protein ACT4O6_08140 [Reyranella sp.]
MPTMKRLRALAAVLGCLAVLAGSLMTVAAATPAAPARSGMDAPCAHCADCDGMPCPSSTAACVQACAGIVPSLAVVAASLPTLDSAAETFRLARTSMLRGLSPPPDPFPPRT